MGTKKRVNPNRIPIKKESFDANEIVRQATQGAVLRAWALVLGSLSNFSEATTEVMLNLWRDVDTYSKTVSRYEDVSEKMAYIEKSTGIHIPFASLSTKNITTIGAANKFRRQAEKNALYAALAIIAEPIVRGELLEEFDIAQLFRRALWTDEELDDKNIALSDILDMLEEEFSVLLYENDGSVRLRVCCTGKIAT